MANNTPWRWNYFTLESLSIIKCSLCDSELKPILRRSEALRKHLDDKQKDDIQHGKAHDDVTSNLKTGKFRWDSHYKIISSNTILKPIIQCEYCDYKPMLNIYDDKRILHIPKGLGEHLENVHKIEYKNWKALEIWIHKNCTNYCDIMPRENHVIKVDTCKACKIKIGAKNAIMFVKHLIDNHEINFPSDIIELQKRDTKEVPLDYDSNDSFGDIITDVSEAGNTWEDLISTSSNRSSTSSNQPSISSNQLSTSSDLPPEPCNIPSTSSKEQLQIMEENLKRMYEFTKNAVKNLKKMKKK